MAMELRGSLNLSKLKTNPNQPKYYGKALINGVEYKLKGWEKVRQDTGEVWISILFEDLEAEAERLSEEFAPAPKKEMRSFKKDWRDDDIPF